MNSLQCNLKNYIRTIIIVLIAITLVLTIAQGCTGSAEKIAINTQPDKEAADVNKGEPAPASKLETGGQSIEIISGDGGELPPAPEIGHPAPDFTLIDLDGNTVNLRSLQGKVVFINFWASWCPPCRAEMPEIEAVYQKYKDKGVVVLGIDMLEPEGWVRQYVRKGGFSWTFVVDTTGEVAAAYSITAIPTSFFIDREGVIRAKSIGAMTMRTMEAELRDVLR